jgi:uncharacterized protein YsxB (DUF464 family)
MIQAHFTRVADTDEILSVKIKGHSGFDDYGYDIVCASVSSLVIAAVNALEEYVGLDTAYEVESGYTSFNIVPIDEYTSIQAQAIANMLFMAIVGMSEEYGDFIRVTIQEE